MIELSNGHKFEYRAASGALGFDGRGWPWEWPLRWTGLIDPKLFTVVLKTLTYKPRQGNLRWHKPWDCVKLLNRGVVNAVGLANPGMTGWSQAYSSRINSKKIPTMASIMSLEAKHEAHVKEIGALAAFLNDFDFVGIELNGSCPNTGEDILENTEKLLASVYEVKRRSRFPIILKLSVVHDDGQTLERIVEETKGVVEAFSINSVPWKIIFGDEASPLAKYGNGGVSGQIAQDYTWPMVRKIVRISDTPVCGPSVWEYDDIRRLRYRGARAIDFGSIFLSHPLRPTAYVRRDQAGNQ